MEQTTPVTGRNESVEEPAVYNEIYEAPAHLRKYRSARLSLGQINSIIADAYKHRIESGDTTLPDYGGAKKRFEENHEIVTGFWVDKENK